MIIYFNLEWLYIFEMFNGNIICGVIILYIRGVCVWFEKYIFIFLFNFNIWVYLEIRLLWLNKMVFLNFLYVWRYKRM